MHAYIITGGSAQERASRIDTLVGERAISPHDVITIFPETASIGVDSVRGVGVRLSIHPVVSSCHAVIVRDAQTMTPEAQNAFLKTLEEPVGNALIILETAYHDTLLPTILSRCHIIRLTDTVSPFESQNEAVSQTLNIIMKLHESSIGERLKLIDAIAKTRDDALSFVDLSIAVLQKELEGNDNHTNLRSNDITKLLHSLLATRTQILGNITPKLALDNIFHSLS